MQYTFHCPRNKLRIHNRGGVGGGRNFIDGKDSNFLKKGGKNGKVNPSQMLELTSESVIRLEEKPNEKPTAGRAVGQSGQGEKRTRKKPIISQKEKKRSPRLDVERTTKAFYWGGNQGLNNVGKTNEGGGRAGKLEKNEARRKTGPKKTEPAGELALERGEMKYWASEHAHSIRAEGGRRRK